MKIKFCRTGGFANIPVNVELDSTTLPEDKATVLQQLITKLLPFKGEKVEPTGNDLCTYELQVEENGQAHSISANDMNLSDDMQNLFDFLMQD